ncbi:MAG: hypothetical protein GX061_03935 [Eubacteriaceae bacterium]|nr:hypothetical protein [Eubacteriaceae bacterium]
MKKRTLGRLGAVSIILCLVTCCLLGGTLAKYTTTVSGTGTATVAKWAIKAGSTDGGTTITAFTLGQATSGVADGKIAPGTSGTLPVYIDLTGTEVATEVKVEIKVDDVGKLPTNFVIKGFDDSALTLTNDTFVTAYTIQKSAAEAATFKTDDTIAWEWPFYTDATNDGEDTTDGTETITAATFTIRVTATQLDEDPTTP